MLASTDGLVVRDEHRAHPLGVGSRYVFDSRFLESRVRLAQAHVFVHHELAVDAEIHAVVEASAVAGDLLRLAE